MRTTEKMNADEAERRIEKPTRYKTRRNSFRLHCAECGQLYYVDAATFRRATSALEGDASEINFCCDTCEQERGEEGYAHSVS